jgi:hypothetical protein
MRETQVLAVISPAEHEAINITRVIRVELFLHGTLDFSQTRFPMHLHTSHSAVQKVESLLQHIQSQIMARTG